MTKVRRQLGNLVALVVLALAGVICGIYIIGHQNAEFPSWMPLIGDDPYVVEAEMETAQGVIPGQGQLVEVAGVIVGRVSGVREEGGRAILDIHLEKGKAKIFRDATVLMRPRTLLKDMILQVTVGTPRAGLLRAGDRIKVANTLPDVNLDELLASLDADTRSALIALAQGAGSGLRGRGRDLAQVWRRFDPTMRHIRLINDEMIKRRREIERVVTNFSLISQTLAQHKGELSRFVRSSNAVFGAMAAEQGGVRETLREFPGTLRELRATTTALTPVARDLGSASRKLLPGARALADGAIALDGLFDDTRGVVRSQLRPLARRTLAPLRDLRAASDDLAPTSASARAGTHDLNRILNDFTFDPKGAGNASYLFWAAWSAHQLNSVLSSEDAIGPYAHTMTTMTCSSLALLPGFIASDPALALTASLANFPKQDDVCR